MDERNRVTDMKKELVWKVRIEEAPGCYGPWMEFTTGAQAVAYIEQEDPGFAYQVQRDERLLITTANGTTALNIQH